MWVEIQRTCRSTALIQVTVMTSFPGCGKGPRLVAVCSWGEGCMVRASEAGLSPIMTAPAGLTTQRFEHSSISLNRVRSLPWGQRSFIILVVTIVHNYGSSVITSEQCLVRAGARKSVSVTNVSQYAG